MADPVSIGDILKRLLNEPRRVIVEIPDQKRSIRLELIDKCYDERFLDLVNDEDIRKYFPKYQADQQTILDDLSKINDFPEIEEWWAIIEGHNLAGYILLKRSSALKNFSSAEPTGNDEEDEADHELMLWRNESTAPFMVEIVVHRDFRRRRVATQAFDLLLSKAINRGAREVYFIVHPENESAKQWVNVTFGTLAVQPLNQVIGDFMIYQYRIP